MKPQSRSAVVALAMMLASCGGSAGSSTPTSSRVTPTMASVAFKIVLPAKTSARRRAPRYVSASTLSAAIGVAAGTASPGPATLVNCTTVCTAQIQAPVGSDTFTVTLYDAQNATGNKLCIGSLTQTIVLNQTNVVNVALEGVVAGLAVVLNPSTTPPGNAATIGVTVNALDAGNNVIIGPGSAVDPLGNPITVTLTDSDTSGATMLSQTSFQVPVSGVTLSYNGTTIPNPTISASAPSLDIAHALLTIGNTPFLFVGNALVPGSTIVGYAAPLGPTSTPILAMTNLTSDPTALLFDGSGNLYTTGYEANVVQIFSPPFTNTSTSIASITNGVDGPIGLGMDHAGRLYIGNNLSASVTIYSPPFTSASSPSITITNGVNALFAMAVDSLGNLYTGGGGYAPGIRIYNPPLSNTSTPAVTISVSPGSLLVDSVGNLYAGVSSGVNIYHAPLTSNSTPSVILNNAGHFPDAMTLDSSGNLYVTYPNPVNEVAVFSPPFTNASTPSIILTSGLVNPAALAIPPPPP